MDWSSYVCSSDLAGGQIELRLPGGIGQVVVATDDVRDAHVVIVDHDRQVVSRRAVRAQDDQVVELLVLEGHVALHMVLDNRAAGLRRSAARQVGQEGVRTCRYRGRPYN